MWKTLAALAAFFALPASAQDTVSRCDLAAADASHSGTGCQRAWMDRNLKLNDLVTVGTHNSYKTEVPAKVLALIRATAPGRAQELDNPGTPWVRLECGPLDLATEGCAHRCRKSRSYRSASFCPFCWPLWPGRSY